MMNGFMGRPYGPGQAQAQWRGSPGPYQAGVGPMGPAPGAGGMPPGASSPGGPTMTGLPQGQGPVSPAGPMPPPGAMPGAPMLPGGPASGAMGPGRMQLAQAIADWRSRRGGQAPMGAGGY